MIAFRIENCQFMKTGAPLALMVHKETQGNPCTTGCYHFKKGACPSYRRFGQVPSNFDVQVMSIHQSHMGLLSLAHALAAQGVRSPGLGIVLHLLTAEDVLQTPDAGKIWDRLKQKYPTDDKGIDLDKLTQDVSIKLTELGLA